jgi:hypothetical protein
MKRLLLFYMLILSMILISGCVGLMLGPPANPNNPIKRVALLPLKNDTTDVGGPNFVRERLAKAMAQRHYNVKPLAETDQILRDRMGITLGGQLEMASIEKLKQELQVEGLVFGTLMDFGETTIGVYNVRKVRGKFKIVNTNTGGVFWKNGIGVKCEDATNDTLGKATAIAANVKDMKDKDVPWVSIPSYAKDEGVEKNLVKSLGAQWITKVLNVHLLRETNEMIKRVVMTLPVGPGPLTLGAVSTAPVLKIPEIGMKMPPPAAIGHMDYGKRDFSAIMETTTIDKKGKESFSFKIPIAKAGKKIRMDMDYAGMAKAGDMPSGIRNIVTIHRGDKQVTYSVYPNKRKYIAHQLTDKNYYEKPDVQKTRLGRETINGHPTDKYKVKITFKNGNIQNGLIWNAKDLDGMTIKSVVVDDKFKVTTILTNIKLITPFAKLFEIPAKYTQANNFMDIVLDNK